MIKTLVLAAGKGSRLKSTTPKVLHKVFDKPILAWVLDSLAEVQQDEISVVCGHKAEQVESFLHAYPVGTVRQEMQMGTGHALMCAAEQFEDFEGTLLVINGDCPLIKADTLNQLLEYHQQARSDMTILTCNLDQPYGYGRIVRRQDQIIGIKEEKDCSEAEKYIAEVNAGVYCMEWSTIKDGLKSLSSNNAQEEYYITDLAEWCYNQGLAVASFEIADPSEVMGVNTRADIAVVTKAKNEESLRNLMNNGVTIIDPSTTMISPDVEIDHDTVIMPNTYIHRRVTIGSHCSIGPGTTIYGPSEIGSGCVVLQSHLTRTTVGDRCSIGPFAHLRDGNNIGNDNRFGSFVEVKNSTIAHNNAIAHLSYIGDTKIRSHANLGAGTITANFDSRSGEKHDTVINNKVSTGANSVLVAPIELHDNSYVAAGSVITSDVPEGELAIARPRQENKKLKPQQLA